MNIPINPFVYRGKSLDNGEWITGYLVEVENADSPEIFTGKYHANNKQPYYRHEIDPSTLGISWGMKDRSGKLIFTGMRARVPAAYNGDYHYAECIATVIFENNEFTLKNMSDPHGVVWQEWSWKELEIIEED